MCLLIHLLVEQRAALSAPPPPTLPESAQSAPIAPMGPGPAGPGDDPGDDPSLRGGRRSAPAAQRKAHMSAPIVHRQGESSDSAPARQRRPRGRLSENAATLTRRSRQYSDAKQDFRIFNRATAEGSMSCDSRRVLYLTPLIPPATLGLPTVCTPRACLEAPPTPHPRGGQKIPVAATLSLVSVFGPARSLLVAVGPRPGPGFAPGPLRAACMPPMPSGRRGRHTPARAHGAACSPPTRGRAAPCRPPPLIAQWGCNTVSRERFMASPGAIHLSPAVDEKRGDTFKK